MVPRYFLIKLDKRSILLIGCGVYSRAVFIVASHADVVRGSSRVPAPLTRDEPLRTSAWEATFIGNFADVVGIARVGNPRSYL